MGIINLYGQKSKSKINGNFFKGLFKKYLLLNNSKIEYK